MTISEYADCETCRGTGFTSIGGIYHNKCHDCEGKGCFEILCWETYRWED